MTVDGERWPGAARCALSVAQARSLVRGALKRRWRRSIRTAAHPYGSLVTVAPEPDGTPLLLLSRLARHTRNLSGRPARPPVRRYRGNGGSAHRPARDPRVPLPRDDSRRRAGGSSHATRAGEASADFPDFRFHAAEVDSGHLWPGWSDCGYLGGESPRHRGGRRGARSGRARHPRPHERGSSEALALCVSAFAGARRASAGLRMTGIDPDGFDVADATQAWRFAFGPGTCRWRRAGGWSGSPPRRTRAVGAR